MSKNYKNIKDCITDNIEIDGSTGCWEWMASKSKSGYGKKKLNYIDWRAHRLAWTLWRGEIPEGLLVCHSCDNPGCVNPEHLWLGSHKDNAEDRAAKGRSRTPRGLDHWRGVLSDENIVVLRRLWATKMFTQKVLAKHYGVSQAHISAVINNKERVVQ